MRCKWISHVAVVAIVVAATALIVEARRVILRPLTAQEVYTVLKAAGREDAVPQGRHIRQGIAAISGFSAGVVSGVGGAIVYDLITAPNETMTWINGLFGISTPNNTAPAQSLSQEICFETRSLEDEPVGRQATTTGTGTMSPTTSPAVGTTPTTTVGTPTSPTSPGTQTSPTSPETGIDTGTTATDGSEGPTCITIEKPKARHRKRRAIVRKN